MGNRFREWRERRNLTLEQVAEALGVAHTTISRWESSDLDWQRKVERLAALFGIKAGELFSHFPESESLTRDERELLNTYRRLDTEDRQRAHAMMKGLFDHLPPRRRQAG